jgi:hypothetical protein
VARAGGATCRAPLLARAVAVKVCMEPAATAVLMQRQGWVVTRLRGAPGRNVAPVRHPSTEQTQWILRKLRCGACVEGLCRCSGHRSPVRHAPGFRCSPHPGCALYRRAVPGQCRLVHGDVIFYSFGLTVDVMQRHHMAAQARRGVARAHPRDCS